MENKFSFSHLFNFHLLQMWTFESTSHASHLEPALGHEEVVFDALVPKLLRHVQAHGSILVVDLPFVLVTEDGVGIVDHLEFFSSVWVVWVLIGVMPQRKFSGYK